MPYPTSYANRPPAPPGFYYIGGVLKPDPVTAAGNAYINSTPYPTGAGTMSAAGGAPGVPGVARAPLSPPLGTYDPSLDSQGRSVQRGLSDLIADSALAGTRRTDDYELQKGLMEDQHKETLQGLMRRYRTLGMQHTMMARRQGVEEGGTMKASNQVRGKNQRRDKTEINETFAQQMGQLALNLSRSQQDSQLAQSRAEREAGFYGMDLNEARWWQARMSGLLGAQ